MKKAVMLNVRIWVEGEDEPAHDFTGSAIDSIRTMFAEYQRGQKAGMSFKVKSISEDYSPENDEEQETKERF